MTIDLISFFTTWGAVIAPIAALISVASIAAQYYLLPKPLLGWEDFHREDEQTVVTVVNRGNAEALDMWVRFERKDDEGRWELVELGKLGTLVPAEGRGLRGTSEFEERVTVTWRQAPNLKRVQPPLSIILSLDRVTPEQLNSPGFRGRDDWSSDGPMTVVPNEPNNTRFWRVPPASGTDSERTYRSGGYDNEVPSPKAKPAGARDEGQEAERPD